MGGRPWDGWSPQSQSATPNGVVAVFSAPGSGEFDHIYINNAGEREPYYDTFGVDGSVTRWRKIIVAGVDPAFNNFDFWVSEWVVDAYDNKTLFEHDSIGRIRLIRHPDGVDEIYTYNPPSLIGTAAGLWDPAVFSGVLVSYEAPSLGVGLSNLSDSNVFYLFTRTGPMTRPFAGDRLFRVYGTKMPMLTTVGADDLYDLPSDMVGTSRCHVTELACDNGGKVIETRYLVADSLLPGAAETDPVRCLQYTYVEVPAASGFFRVATETYLPSGHVWHFAYVVDSLDPRRVVQAKRTCSEKNTEVTTTFDAWRRPTSIVTMVSDNLAGRPRSLDTDAAGKVEPLSTAVSYTYGTCGSCVMRPTKVEHYPSGRTFTWDYDANNGLVISASYPSPTGTGTATENFVWMPLVAGVTHKGYRLHSHQDAAGRTWTTTYPADSPRIDPAHGVKAAEVRVSSPVVATASPAGVVTRTSYFRIIPGPWEDHNGLHQVRMSGLLLSTVDGDGVNVTYDYDPRGLVSEIVEGANAPSAKQVKTEFAYDSYGRPTQVKERAGSTKEQTLLIDYNAAGRVIRTRATVGAQQIEQRLFYDQFGNLAVRLRKNLDSAGGLPVTLKGTVTPAREWLREEWHYDLNRLVTIFEDRRPLNEGDSGPVADDPSARFLRTDVTWLPRGLIGSVGLPNGAIMSFTYDGYDTVYKQELTGVGGQSLVSRVFLNDAFEPVRMIQATGADKLITTVVRNAAGVVEAIHEPSLPTPAGYPGDFTTKFAIHEFDTNILGETIESRVLDGGSMAVLRKTKTFYDVLGRVHRVEVPDQLVGTNPVMFHDILWSGASKMLRVTDAAGRFMERDYDALGRVKEVRDSRPGNPNKTVFEFLDNTDLVEKTIVRNFDEVANAYVDRETSYLYDTLGRVTQVNQGSIIPLESFYSYYATGQVQSYTGPSGKIEKFLPDALGRLTQRLLPVTAPGANPIWNGSMHQDWAGNATSRLIQEDGEGRLTTSVMDFAGRLSAILEPGGTTMPTAAVPNQPYGKYYAYDATSRLQTMHVGEDGVMQFVRDGAGRVLGRVRGWNPNLTPDEHYLVSTFYAGDAVHWDALGRVLETRSYMGDGTEYIREQFTHDGLGRLTAEKFKHLYGANWNDVLSGYVGADGFRRSVSYQNHLAGSEDLFFTMTPDEVGRFGEISWAPTSSATPNLLAAYKHEGGAIRRRSTTIPGWSLSPNDTTYTYDHYGRMSGIAHSLSVDAGVSFHYDEASNLIKEVYKKQGAPLAQGDQFAYDEHHRLAKAWLGSQDMSLGPDASAFHKKITYGLDEANNRTGVTEQLGPSGTPTSAAYVPDSGTTTGSPSNRYSTAEGIQPLYDTRGNTIFDGFRYYIYDAFNRLTEVYEPVAPSGGSQQMAMSMASEESYGTEESLGFAPISDDPQPVLPLATSSLAPMQAARAAIMERVGADQEALLRRVNDPTLIAEISEPIVLAPSAPAEGASMAMAMASQQSSGPPQLVLRAVYTYDLFNRRVARYVIGEHLYHYAWDGWREAQQCVNVFDGTILPVTQFAWGEQLDEMVAYRHKPNSANGVWFNYYIAEGGAHCPSRVLDASGAVVEIQEYDPYGKTTYFNGSGVEIPHTLVGNRFGWKNHRIDPETGLVYMRHRYYLPWWGRFLTSDPIGIWGDIGNLGNQYAYGWNRPGVVDDRYGLWGWGIFAAVIAVVDFAVVAIATGDITAAAASAAAVFVAGVTLGAASLAVAGPASAAVVAAAASVPATIVHSAVATGNPPTTEQVVENMVIAGAAGGLAGAMPAGGGRTTQTGGKSGSGGTPSPRNVPPPAKPLDPCPQKTVGQMAPTKPPAPKANGPLKPGDTGSYWELATQRRKFGQTEPIDIDHQPSFAAQRIAAERAKGSPLSPKEARELYKESPAVASPTELHRSTSPTYGGRNTPARQNADAGNLEAAQARDRAILEQGLQDWK